MGEDKNLCHYFIFVIKNENKDTHYKYTQYTNKINSVLFSGRLQLVYLAGAFKKLNEQM